jgi:23S rRNA (cytidine1920-2'-O)/16S rRNA (cytidine1409-2'-O)-methyltransferase
VPRVVAGDHPLAVLCNDTAVERARRRRLDQLLVDRGLVETRTRAQALVLAGRVRVGEGDGARRDLKPGDLVADAVHIQVASGPDHASRGGDKLAGALDPLGVDPSGRVCLDVGASTGGFTDVLLRRGAVRVHAVDVGRGQLIDRLARDPRVIVHDRTNARALTAAAIGEPATLATIDVSFISLRLVLAPVASCLAVDGGSIVALVKPQFEAGRERVRDGVVRDPAVHRETATTVAAHAARLGLAPMGFVASPLLGPAGNREFFLRVDVPMDWDGGAHAGWPGDTGVARDMRAAHDVRAAELDPDMVARIEEVTRP